MVQKLETKNQPATTPFDLTLYRGDTLVIQVDQDKFDIEEASKLTELYREQFPNNNIICTFEGIEIKGVIHAKLLHD